MDSLSHRRSASRAIGVPLLVILVALLPFLLPLLLPLLLPAALRAQAVQEPAQPPFAPTDRIPFDPAVTTDTLANGLRYYIRPNERPDDRVLMQLAVRAGSVDETDEQQGLAHFL